METDKRAQSLSDLTNNRADAKVTVHSLQWRVSKQQLDVYVKALVALHTPTTNPDKARELRNKMIESAQAGAEELYNFFSDVLGILGGSKRRNREAESFRVFVLSPALAALSGAFEAIKETCDPNCAECEEYAKRALEESKRMLDLAISMGSITLLRNRIEAARILAEGIDEIKDTPAFREFVKKIMSEKQPIVSIRLPKISGYNVNAPKEFSELFEVLGELLMRCGIKKRGLKSKITEACLRPLFERPDRLETDDLGRYQIELEEPFNELISYAHHLGKKHVQDLIWTR